MVLNRIRFDTTEAFVSCILYLVLLFMAPPGNKDVEIDNLTIYLI